jgi:hypothetical protein
MATKNTIIDDEWSLVANSVDDPVLIQPYSSLMQVEYLATAELVSEVDADLLGHRLTVGEALTRAVIGDGYIWARVWGRTKPGALVVSGSTVDFTESGS